MKQLKKILHIDDDAMMRMMVEKSIERSHKGFELISCVTPSEFIEKLSILTPDLLIIDIAMPVLDGPSLLRKIRALPNTTPAIFMTGHENPEFQNREELEPLVGILHKPFSPLSLGDDLLKLWASYSNAPERNHQRTC